MNDIKRQVELWLVAQLTAAVPGEAFYPSQGGANTTPATEILPPFTVIEALDATRAMPEEPTYVVEVAVTRYAHFADTASADQSTVVRAIIDALVQLAPGWFDDFTMRVHGTWFRGQEEGVIGDKDGAARMDRMDLVVGCSG